MVRRSWHRLVCGSVASLVSQHARAHRASGGWVVPAVLFRAATRIRRSWRSRMDQCRRALAADLRVRRTVVLLEDYLWTWWSGTRKDPRCTRLRSRGTAWELPVNELTSRSRATAPDHGRRDARGRIRISQRHRARACARRRAARTRSLRGARAARLGARRSGDRVVERARSDVPTRPGLIRLLPRSTVTHSGRYLSVWSWRDAIASVESTENQYASCAVTGKRRVISPCCSERYSRACGGYAHLPLTDRAGNTVGLARASREVRARRAELSA